MSGKSNLLHLVSTLDASGRLSSRLNGREQNGNQDGDDCNHCQQFYQCERFSSHEYLFSATLPVNHLVLRDKSDFRVNKADIAKHNTATTSQVQNCRENGSEVGFGLIASRAACVMP